MPLKCHVMPPKATKKSVRTRASALLQAEHLYSVGGYEAINLQLIAEAVGVTKAALFYHFDGKQALFAAMLEAMLERYGRLIDSSLAQTQGPSRDAFLALSLALSKQPMFDAFRFLRSEQHHLSETEQDQLRHACNTFLFHPIKRAFTLALERGEVRQVNVAAACDLYLGFCVLASSMRAMQFGALTEAGHQDMFEVFWHGVALD